MSIALYSPKLKLAEVLQGEVYELPLNCVIEQQSISIGLGYENSNTYLLSFFIFDFVQIWWNTFLRAIELENSGC